LLAETQLSTASATLKKAIEDYLAGSAALRQEIDPQIDDLFQISAEDEAEEQRLRDVLVDVLPYFTEKARVTVRDLDIYGVDPSEDLQRNDSFTLDLRHLFGSTVENITPADWRTLLNNAFLDGTTGKVALLDDTVDGILPMVNHPVTGERVVEGTAVSKVADALCDNAATVADYLNLGVPFIPLAGGDVFTVLETLLGPRGGGVNWRLFKYDSSAGAFSEITAAGTDTFDFNTGYFLIATNGCQTDTIDFGITGVPALSLDDFTFTVEPGKWTLFSNPFHFDIQRSVALSSDAPAALSDVFHWLTGVGTMRWRISFSPRSPISCSTIPHLRCR
jgi:hypothetical protein